MPKYGVTLSAGPLRGPDFDVCNLIALWVRGRKQTRRSKDGLWVQRSDESRPRRRYWARAVPDADLGFLIRCALQPVFVLSPPGSIGAEYLGSEEVGARFARIFSEYPDDAVHLFSYVRKWKRLKQLTKQQKARVAVRMLIIENKCMPIEVTQDEIAGWLAAKYGGGDWSATVEDALDIENGRVSGKTHRAKTGQAV